ncbi:hypothetical protein QQS21_006662 [Conoideocrella luteorostrata]|uniref:Cell wall galactomannoprotein Mp2/allergen F17-like protein n=1 Tax=Conoideocrella luteorostrata TaxID=1105319 RepID=A0AAJ0CMJ6_9HYPO|nr:hypothetical protein QQS21_006662 [Conoideocrella luteorostrata]
MKSLALFTLATSAFAAVLFDRDLATIKAVMTTAGDNIIGLDNAVKGFSSDSGPVVAAADILIQSLKDGKAKVDPTDALSLGDALGLQDPAKDLQSKADTLLADFKARKDAIAKNGFCETTFTKSSAINAASKDLIDSIVSKVPQSAQGIAKNIVAGFLKTLQDAQDTFSPENCKNTGSPPASSGTSTVSVPGTTTGTATMPGTTTGTASMPDTATGTASTTCTSTVTTSDTISTPPISDSCPAASTVTITATDSNDCVPTPTCTKKPPVTVTTTTKACPTVAQLFW